MTLIPGIKQISQVGNDMYAQGAFPVAIGTTNVDYLADPADTRLLAGRDPVLEEVSVGMSGVETEIKSIMSGTQPLVIPDAYYGNMKFLEVKFHPEQDYHGYSGPWPAGGGVNLYDLATMSPSSSGSWTKTATGFTCSPMTEGQDPTIMRIMFPWNTSATNITVSFDVRSSVDGTEFRFDGQPDSLYTSNTDFYDKTVTANIASQRIIYNGNILNGTTMFRLFRLSSDTNATTATIYVDNIQIAYGNVSTYSPYSNICPITGYSEIKVYIEPAYDAAATPKAVVQLGDTYYYGTIDLVGGFLAATHVMTVFNGTEGWSTFGGGGGKFQKTLTGTSYTVPGYDASTPLNQIRCSIVPNKTRHQVADNNLGICIVNTSVFAIFISSSITTEAQMKSYLAGLYAAGTPMQILSRLAAPQYIQIHGANNLLLQTGTNTVWTDTNENDISVAYVTEK